MGCDFADRADINNFNWISIHAPAWGATILSIKAIPSICISIHAPAWGATAVWTGVFPLSSISIHAPAWGATPL